MIKRLPAIIGLLLWLGGGARASAEEIILLNQDRISGTIIKEDAQHLELDTEAMGPVSINREFVKESIRQQPVEEETPNPWERSLSAGYSVARGNSESKLLNGELLFRRKTDQDETTLKAGAAYSSTNRKMDGQRWQALTRYAYSFGREKKWYHFYKTEYGHDRFANIAYRITPSTGAGYWFSDQPHWKLMGEVGVGFEHTSYRDNTKDSNEAIMTPRVFLEKQLWERLTLTQDATLYPSLSEGGDFRLHSETSLINPINEASSLRLSLINDYDSSPSPGTKKHDLRLVSSLVYSF